MDALTLILLSLATYRVAHMVAREEGPWSCFTRLRGALDPDQHTWLGRGVNCVLCVAFWTVWAVLGLWWLWPPIVWALAASGGASLLWIWENKR